MDSEGTNPSALAQLLRTLRLKAFPTTSLKMIADQLNVSANYLTKLEGGYVKIGDSKIYGKMMELYKPHPYLKDVAEQLWMSGGDNFVDKMLDSNFRSGSFEVQSMMHVKDPILAINNDLPTRTIATCYSSKPWVISKSLSQNNILITTFGVIYSFMHSLGVTDSHIDTLKEVAEEWPQRLFVLDPRFKRASGYAYDVSCVDAIVLYDRTYIHFEAGSRRDFVWGPLTDYFKARSLPPHVAKTWIEQLWTNANLTFDTLNLSDPDGQRFQRGNSVTNPHREGSPDKLDDEHGTEDETV